MSHPTWVRGLKPSEEERKRTLRVSHPTWVRGLKLKQRCRNYREVRVAPYVGAWIETTLKQEAPVNLTVAPYVGAWIETSARPMVIRKVTVAPYVGAWIETIHPAGRWPHGRSHPTWVRGLKQS